MEPQIYRLSPAAKSVMIQALTASLLAALVVSAFALLAPPRDKSQLVPMYALMISFYASSFFFWINLPACDAYIEVTEKSIAQHHPRKPTIELAWSEISQVKNNPVMQRLEIYSRNGKTKIYVEHQVENFAQLKQLIESKLGV